MEAVWSLLKGIGIGSILLVYRMPIVEANYVKVNVGKSSRKKMVHIPQPS
jgi:hypothetical protein